MEDRSPENTSEIVLPFRCSRQASAVRNPIICIQNIVSKIIECVSVKLVGARAGADYDLAPRRPPVLRGVGGRLNAKFLKSVYRNEAARSPERIESLGPARTTLTEPGRRNNAEVSAGSVDLKRVRIRSLTIYAELPVISGKRVRRGNQNSRCQLKQGIKTPAIER